MHGSFLATKVKNTNLPVGVVRGPLLVTFVALYVPCKRATSTRGLVG